MTNETKNKICECGHPLELHGCLVTIPHKCDNDLFDENVKDEWLNQVFAVMALTPHITYQVLTKRPERMAAYFADMKNVKAGVLEEIEPRVVWVKRWPLPNVWLGVSVEDQKTADERIPLLLETPAAVRFLSVEPLLGPVDLLDMPGPLPADARDPDDECSDSPFEYELHSARDYDFLGHTYELDEAAFNEFKDDDAAHSHFCKKCGMRPQCPWHRGMGEPYIDWVIVGGESGPNRRVAKLEWIESIVAQCKAASVPVFVKQIELGGKVEKDIDQFPAHLQIREFPNV